MATPFINFDFSMTVYGDSGNLQTGITQLQNAGITGIGQILTQIVQYIRYFTYVIILLLINGIIIALLAKPGSLLGFAIAFLGRGITLNYVIVNLFKTQIPSAYQSNITISFPIADLYLWLPVVIIIVCIIMMVAMKKSSSS